MFSAQLYRYIQTLGVECPISGLSKDESALLTLCWATLPQSDLVSVSPQVILQEVRHGLFLREHSPYAKKLPEALFLQFVLYPRINSENLESCRSFFYSQLAPRIAGLSEAQAALEVNRWCAEHMTYAAADDRTESPMTAYRCGVGRCGEESVFAVAALRSVGLAARQIYVPYWSHCDDNHAWVEVYTDGEWKYLGACEPEPVLNRGWFTDAASRAELACYRSFFSFGLADEIIDRQGCCTLYNRISAYAPARKLEVQVTRNGSPAANALVTFCVPNMAALRPIARLSTDSQGSVFLHLGLGDIWIEAHAPGFSGTALVSLQSTSRIVLELSPELPETQTAFVFHPASSSAEFPDLTPEQRLQKQQILAECARKRQQLVSRPALWGDLLAGAGENASALASLALTPEAPLYYKILCSLRKKDLYDTAPQLLQSHLSKAAAYQNTPHFLQEILCPRLGNEMLECWREPILQHFPAELLEQFRDCPETLSPYLDAHFPEADLRCYPAVPLSPRMVLRLHKSDCLGRQTLAAAILRTIGVPARLNSNLHRAEYFRSGEYHPVWPQIALSFLTGQTALSYGAEYTLTDRNGADYPLDGTRQAVPPGRYRLFTANRLPNGNQLCRLTEFTMTSGQECTLSPTLWEASPEEMLSDFPLPHFGLESHISGKTLLIYLDPGKEPTQHVLNELLDAAFNLQAEKIRLVLAAEHSDASADPVLRKVLSSIPQAIFLRASFAAQADMLARKVFLEPGVYPLLLLTDETRHCYYAACGYQVGAVALALKLAKCIARTG